MFSSAAGSDRRNAHNHTLALPADFPVRDLPAGNTFAEHTGLHGNIEPRHRALHCLHPQGRPVNNLTIDDFHLYVDGSPRKIDSPWRDADLPLLLGVIEDISESQKTRISEKDRAVNQVLEQIVHGQDRAFVTAVNDRVILTSEVTAGTYGLRYRVMPPGGEELGVQCGSLTGDHGHPSPLCGGTALWNAVYASAHLKFNTGSKNKVLLVLSDGNDTGSTHSISEALRNKGSPSTRFTTPIH